MNVKNVEVNKLKKKMTELPNQKENKTLVDISKYLLPEIKKFSLPPSYFESFFASIKESAVAINNAKEVVTRTIEANRKLLESIGESISKAFTFSTDFTERFKKLEEETRAALKDTGWIICPSLMQIPVNDLSFSVKRYSQGDKGRSITKTIKDFYGLNSNWEILETTVNGWKTHKLFTKQRMRIIYDALEAHKEKKFTLSIPSLLPQIEGIITEYIKNKPGEKIPMSKSLKKAQKAIGLQGETFGTDTFLYFMEEQLYVDTDTLGKKRNRKNLNRHGILHGKYPGYPDCTRSLKCFMILDVICSFKD